MALTAGLFRDQDQAEQDHLNGPGWTIDDQRPGFWAGFGAAPALRGIGQGAADGISVLASGLQYPDHESAIDAVMSGPAAAARAVAGKTELEPWKVDFNAKVADMEDSSRQFAKSLIPDPRTTGVAANLAQGFAKSVTEFAAGAAAGGPVSGALLLGTTEGHAQYRDLLDQGVDPATARRSALLTGTTNAVGAVLPMAVPAKILAGLSTAGTLLTQAGVGGAINTAFGVSSRYASAKILSDAGYPEMAAQQQPWDETNLLTDALSGLFFGAHAGWHGLKAENAGIDPSIRDAAKVVQDRQETVDRAPGVPVDMASAAIHRQSLETALGDLLNDHPVELRGDDLDGATFARPDEDTVASRQIMREEFEKSGVLDDAAAFDRWLKGEPEPPQPEVPAAEPSEADKAFVAESNDFVSSIKEREEPAEPGEAATTDIATRAVQDRPDLEVPDARADQTRSRLDEFLGRAQKRHAMEGQGQDILDRMEESDESPRDVSREFWSNTYDKLNDANRRRFERQANSLTGWEPGSALSTDREGNVETARDWRHIGETLGQDLADKPSQLEGPERGYVSLMKWANDQAATRPGAERASEVLQIAKEDETQANQEAEPMHRAAVECEARHA